MFHVMYSMYLWFKVKQHLTHCVHKTATVRQRTSSTASDTVP
uniref:Uncharacterized protein n=1 Tax=Anguilla anguilla TaxID=7936 RepID=A0A0E9T476_ANGAN